MLSAITPPRCHVPEDGTDCHVHVFDPQRFPFDAARSYTPPAATVSDLVALQARIGLQRVVLVQPSCYGFDNAALLDALARLGAGRARGVAVVDFERTPPPMLQDLHARGVRGVRLNVATQRTGGLAAVRAQVVQAHRAIAPLGWSLQLHCSSALVAELLPTLVQVECALVLDHFAGLRAQAGPQDDPAWAAIRTLLDRGRTYIKLSAPYRVSGDPTLRDVAPLARALVYAAPERMLWGSDWPHTGGAGVRATSPAQIEPFRPIDAGAVLDLLVDWAPAPEHRRRILVTNPAAVFGFDADAGAAASAGLPAARTPPSTAPHP